MKEYKISIEQISNGYNALLEYEGNNVVGIGDTLPETVRDIAYGLELVLTK